MNFLFCVNGFTITSWFLTQVMLIDVVRCWRFMQTNLVCGDEILKNSKQEKMLGVTLDNKLNFATQLLNITKNASKKFNALTRVRKAYVFLLF